MPDVIAQQWAGECFDAASRAARDGRMVDWAFHLRWARRVRRSVVLTEEQAAEVWAALQACEADRWVLSDDTIAAFQEALDA